MNRTHLSSLQLFFCVQLLLNTNTVTACEVFHGAFSGIQITPDTAAIAKEICPIDSDSDGITDNTELLYDYLDPNKDWIRCSYSTLKE